MVRVRVHIHSLAGMECHITVLYTTDGNDFGKGRHGPCKPDKWIPVYIRKISAYHPLRKITYHSQVLPCPLSAENI